MQLKWRGLSGDGVQNEENSATYDTLSPAATARALPATIRFDIESPTSPATPRTTVEEGQSDDGGCSPNVRAAARASFLEKKLSMGTHTAQSREGREGIIGFLKREARAASQRLIETLADRPISVLLAFVLWTALIVVSNLPAVCVADMTDPAATVCLDGKSYWTVSLLVGALLLMANDASPDLVMLGFSVLLVLSDVISNGEAWAGFSSTSVLSIGALFVVARALEETRAVEKILLPLLGKPAGHVSALLRLCFPVAVFSAFLNNTPIVAMLLPVSEGWAAGCNLSIKVLLIPLSFASMLGGMCTLIGTSTNLVLNAQIEADPNAPLKPLSMFSMSLVGFPAAVAGILYLSVAAPLAFRVVPTAQDKDGKEGVEDPEGGAVHHAPRGFPERFGSRGSPRYTIEALVTHECHLLIGEVPTNLGKLVIPSCGVRLLIRGGVVHPVCGGSSELVIEVNDRLLIACLAEAVLVLRNVIGLQLRPDTPELLMEPRNKSSLVMVEAAVATGSPLVHLPLIEALNSPAFRGADVWAIRQRGQHSEGAARHGHSMPIRMLTKRQNKSWDGQALDDKTPQQEPISSTSPRSPSVPLSSLETACQRIEEGTLTNERTHQVWSKEGGVMREISNLGHVGTRYAATSVSRSLKSHHSSDSDPRSGGAGSAAGAAKRNSLTHISASVDIAVPMPAHHGKQSSRCGENRRLRAGDTLLVEAPDSWVQAQRCTHYFAVLSPITEDTVGGYEPSKSVSSAEAQLKLAASILALLCLLILSALDLVSLFPLALALSFFLVSIGCITLDQAWGSIGYRLLLTIACSFGPGAALTNTNVATIIGTGLIELQVLGRFGFLLAIYLITSAMSCLVSNSATVVAFYSVLRVIKVPGLTAEQLMITMMLGASSAFATPIGYQTNLMVLGRGGYVFSDFLALGGGLTIITGVCVSGLSLLVL